MPGAQETIAPHPKVPSTGVMLDMTMSSARSMVSWIENLILDMKTILLISCAANLALQGGEG